MIGSFWLWFGAAARFFRSRKSLLLENLALRQQLTILEPDLQSEKATW